MHAKPLNHYWSIIVFCALVFSGCKEIIWHALEEPKANQVLVALADAGIKAHKVQDGTRWNIAVERNDTDRALKTLDKHRLLQRRLTTDANNNKKLITSREERRRILETNLANNLTDTLESLPGVLEAHVHFYFADQTQFEFTKIPPKTSASIVLITKGNPLVTDEHIKNLISGATGIDTANIKVLFALEANNKSLEPSTLPANATSPLRHFVATRLGNYITTIAAVIAGLMALGLLFLLRRRLQQRAFSKTANAENTTTALHSTESSNEPQLTLITPFPQTVEEN